MKKVTVYTFDRKNELWVKDNTTIQKLTEQICIIRKLNSKNWGLDDHRRKKIEIYNPKLPSENLVTLPIYYLYPILSNKSLPRIVWLLPLFSSIIVGIILLFIFIGFR